MKNTLILDIDRGGICNCIDAIHDKTNTLFIEAHSPTYDSLIFNVLDGEYSKNLSYIKKGDSFLVEIPKECFIDHLQFTLNIGGAGSVITLYFLCNQVQDAGNLLIKQQTEKGYILRSFIKNTTGVPIATRDSLGVVKIGNGLDIEGDGNLSSKGGEIESLTQEDIDRILI